MADISTPFVAGSTAQSADPSAADDENSCRCYCQGDATRFNVRVGPDYNKNKRKEPSIAAYYDLARFDGVCRRGGRVGRVVESGVLTLPEELLEDTGVPGVPPVIVICAQMPMEQPSMFSGPSETDPCQSTMFTFTINPATVQQLQQAEDQWHPALRLLVKWLRTADTDPDMHSRFKVIVSARDLSNLPSMISMWNAKPVIVNKTGAFMRGKGFVEFDVDFFQFPYRARLGLHSINDWISTLVVDVGFVIEGRSDDELPEVMMGTGTMVRMDRASTPYVAE